MLEHAPTKFADFVTARVASPSTARSSKRKHQHYFMCRAQKLICLIRIRNVVFSSGEVELGRCVSVAVEWSCNSVGPRVNVQWQKQPASKTLVSNASASHSRSKKLQGLVDCAFEGFIPSRLRNDTCIAWSPICLLVIVASFSCRVPD